MLIDARMIRGSRFVSLIALSLVEAALRELGASPFGSSLIIFRILL